MKKFAVGMSFLLALGSTTAHAGGGAPAMYGVKEVIIQTPIFANSKASDDCGLTAGDIATTIKTALVSNGVPAFAVTEAKAATAASSRINLVPEIVSYNNQGLDCTSWVSLAVETDNNVNIPPIDILRSVTVVYWHEGNLVNSSQAIHQQTLVGALQKMIVKFSKQYHRDQTIGN